MNKIIRVINIITVLITCFENVKSLKITSYVKSLCNIKTECVHLKSTVEAIRIIFLCISNNLQYLDKTCVQQALKNFSTSILIKHFINEKKPKRTISHSRAISKVSVLAGCSAVTPGERVKEAVITIHALCPQSPALRVKTSSSARPRRHASLVLTRITCGLL